MKIILQKIPFLAQSSVRQKNIRTKEVLLIFLFLTLSSVVSPAQPGMIVEHYTTDDGLLNNTVYNSLKDSDGFVWFGTWHGLCSFDGTEFTPFVNRRNRHSDIPPRKVFSIVEDATGNLWIRNADNHLYMFDRRTEIYHDIYRELKRLSQNVQVIKIQKMDNGHVLLLTRNKNMYEAYAGKDGKVSVTKIYDGRNDTDRATMRLRRNVLGETADRVYWIDRRLQMDVITKRHRKPVFPGGPPAGVTCFRRQGQYLFIGTDKGQVYMADISSGKGCAPCFSTGKQSPVTSIVTVDGRVYVSCAEGLCSFARGGQTVWHTAELRNAMSPYVDKYGKLWFYTSRRALVCYDPAAGSTRTFDIPADSLLNELKFADAGRNGLFILLLSGDVWRYDRATGMMTDVKTYAGIGSRKRDQRFLDLELDRDGRLWLSTTTDGVYKLSFPRQSFGFLFPGLLSATAGGGDNAGVRAVYQSRGGDLWIGTRGGDLYCVDIRTGEVKKHFNGGIGSVYHIMEDHSGNLWLSTKGAGLVKATPDIMAPQGLRLTRYMRRAGDKSSISSNRVYYTFQDSRGRIWVCTFDGGLNLMEEKDGRTVFYSKGNGLAKYPQYDLYMNVRAITEDRGGRLWVATTDGLMSFDGAFGRVADIDFETYRERNSADAVDNDIFTLFRDSAGDIWMGIFGNGLNKLERYDARHRKPVLRAYGLAGHRGGEVVGAIAEDSHHCLWICTETGLASLARGAASVRNYDRFAGFPAVNIEDNTSVVTRDGRVLIGCRQGLLAFSPSVVEKENNRQYSTYIVDFKVLNRNLNEFTPPIYEGSLRYARGIELRHDQNMFTIEFATLTFADPGHVTYSYILDGFEEQWHNSGGNRVASYANVPPGHYKFRVRPMDGRSPERVLEITVLPPWWATWWAYTFYGIVICLMLYGVVRLVLYMIRIRNEVYISERLAELKIRFFTNVSHELRTPLTLIKGPIGELRSTEKLSATGKEYLALIDRNASKMLQLVNQILDFRKVQNGKMKLHVSLVDINNTLENLRLEFRMLAEERDIAFHFDLPEEHVMMWCDPEKISVVLNNLINNAFKYTPESGTICVALEHDSGRRLCRIRVEDDGVTIPKSQLEEIFERFSQADNNISDDQTHAGTGIGLSLSREYVAMHHGRIWAENLSAGKGVAFTVELPVGKEHFSDDVEVYIDDISARETLAMSGGDTGAGEESGAAEDVAQGQKPRQPVILVIEDNADLCRMVSLQLRDSYSVCTANGGEDGLKKVYRYHPDVIITDLMMPGMDGMEVLRRVRQDFNVSHTPVIVLTAKHNEDARMRAVKAGANAYITKPFSSSYLVARISQLLEEQRIFQRKMVIMNAMEKNADAGKDDYEQHLVRKDIEFVHKIHGIIEQNLNSNDFNINTIAETIGLSRSAFFKKLKSLTGFAPVDLVKEIRLTKAARQIEMTDDSITEIAYSVGFHDAGYFGKCFRQKFGKTPKDYRAECKKATPDTPPNLPEGEGLVT